LFGLVTKSSGFVRSGWSGGSYDSGHLTEFPGSDSHDESHHIWLLLLPKFFKIFVGSHYKKILCIY
jgi:hypothetical protein